eukprot:5489698-Amphidinium_carterae.1
MPDSPKCAQCNCTSVLWLMTEATHDTQPRNRRQRSGAQNALPLRRFQSADLNLYLQRLPSSKVAEK